MPKKIKESQYCVSKINTEVLNYNVYVMKGAEKLLYRLLLLVLGGSVGLIFYGGLFKVEGQATTMTTISNSIVFVVVGILANKYFLPTITEMLRKKRLNKLKKQFCDFAAALTNALASGMNMNDSLQAVYGDLISQYSEDSFIVKEVEEVINGMKNNIPIEEMLEDFGNRSGISDIVNFSKVFSICYRTGGDIKSIVRRTSEIISEKTMVQSEVETIITSNKLQMMVMNVLPIVIVLMMKSMSQDFADSFGSIVGVIGITVSVSLTVVAYKLGQKITDIKG